MFKTDAAYNMNFLFKIKIHDGCNVMPIKEFYSKLMPTLLLHCFHGANDFHALRRSKLYSALLVPALIVKWNAWNAEHLLFAVQVFTMLAIIRIKQVNINN